MMMRSFAVALFAMLQVAAASASDHDASTCCGPGGCSGPDMPVDPVAVSQDTDDELNRTYHVVLTKYADDADAVAAIRAAQRAWIALRDRDLDAQVDSWGAVLDPADPAMRQSVLYNDLVQRTNLQRAAFLCDAYLAPRG